MVLRCRAPSHFVMTTGLSFARENMMNPMASAIVPK
jgi:hypothetical protein